MDVVGRGIVVLDLHGLPGHYAENMGMILAAFLIEYDGVFGKVESAVAEAVLHVDKDIRKIAAADHDVLGFVGSFAAGVLAHVDLGGFGSGAGKFHSAIDGGNGGRIDRGGSGLRALFGRRVVGLLGIFFLAAGRQSQQST